MMVFLGGVIVTTLWLLLYHVGTISHQLMLVTTELAELKNAAGKD